jgi:hypothetical protein
MKIELKNFKHYERLSEETYCFVANLWINGVKAGTTQNNGIGGHTAYYQDNQEGRKLIKQAEEYCLNLPPDKWVHNGKEYTTKMDLYHYIDNLVNELIREKYKQKDLQKLRKNMEKAILIGNDETYTQIGFKMPLRELMEKHSDYFKKVLKEKIEKHTKEGYRLLNTNIPQHFLN